jgi:hypothetical protein
MTNYSKFPSWRKNGIVIKFDDHKFSWCDNTLANRKYLKTSAYCINAIEFFVWENNMTYHSKMELDDYFDDREKNPHKFMTCSLCGNPLILRKNKQNGESFLGCSKYPECKFIKKS